MNSQSGFSSLQKRVRDEIEALHTFFVGWFTGKLAKHEFEARFSNRFEPDLVFVPPAGQFLGLPDLSTAVQAGYNTNPQFRIEIRKVQVHRIIDNYVLATYQEWQRNALASTSANNGRLASVLFKDTGILRWCHIHETWLPEGAQAADLYDF